MNLRYGTLKVRAGTEVKFAILQCFGVQKTLNCTVLKESGARHFPERSMALT